MGLLVIYILVIINFMLSKMKDFSCHVQNIFEDNLYVKHGFNLLAIFFVLVIFTRSKPVSPNVLIGLSVGMYIFFIMLTRCDFMFLVGFMMCVTVVFYIEADKQYRAAAGGNDGVSESEREQLVKRAEKIQGILYIISVGLVLLGLLVYIGSHSREYKKNWSWRKFIWGVSKCKGNGSQSKSVLEDMKDGVKRIFK